MFISSISWLDVEYGVWLQEAVLMQAHMRYVFDYPHRSFKKAEVNTIITVMERKKDILLDPAFMVKFIKLKKKIGTLTYNDFKEIVTVDESDKNKVEIFGAEFFLVETNTAKYKILDELNLAKLGGAQVQREMGDKEKYSFREYIGAMWGGILIRAPEIFYIILRKGKNKLVRLGEIADIRFGIKTGANEFFYLEPIKSPDEWPLCNICGRIHSKDEGLIAVKNDAGWEGYIEEEFLEPLVKSPRELKHYQIKLEDLNYKVFICNISKKDLIKANKYHALKYIEWGESKGYHNRSTCRARAKAQNGIWWGLGFWRDADVILPMFEDKRKYAFLNAVHAKVDAALYLVYYGNNITTPFMFSLLNSTYVGFLKEILARPPEGGGAIQMKVYHYMNMPVILVDANFHNSYSSLSGREIKTIFEELGLPAPARDLSNINPDDLSLDKVMPDRRELDKIIFEALGLTEEEQLEVYRSVVELVKERLLKSKTFGDDKND